MTRPKVEFEVGCFDHLLEEGMTQLEVDLLVAYVLFLAETGQLFGPVDDLTPEELSQLTFVMESVEKNTRQ